MLEVLVAVEDYVNHKNTVAHRFVHVRNLYYQRHGINVTVLNFRTSDEYMIDGIRVIGLAQYKDEKMKFDVLICHQANLKHHYLFLKKYGKRFKKFIFFFHGHEVLNINKVYAKPYDYNSKSFFKYYLQSVYDEFKLNVWKKYYDSVVEKSKFVFVSQWMLNEFLKWVKIPYSKIKDNTYITYNCIGEEFENSIFDMQKNKIYDFITIRSNLDGSKYCIDVVNNLAKYNSNLTFLVVGKGKFFDHYQKAPNLTWLNTALNHKEIVNLLNKSRCALMPTRTDAQGLMMCEMASIGIPLITSDIPVCHEVFDGFKNVALIKNDSDINLTEILDKLENGLPYERNTKYYNSNTSFNEIKIIKS